MLNELVGKQMYFLDHYFKDQGSSLASNGSAGSNHGNR